jgi:hypothetical protein
VSASQPLTGDELAAIKAHAEAARDRVYGRGWYGSVGMDPETAVRLVAEVERLRAQVATDACE